MKWPMPFDVDEDTYLWRSKAAEIFFVAAILTRLRSYFLQRCKEAVLIRAHYMFEHILNDILRMLAPDKNT